MAWISPVLESRWRRFCASCREMIAENDWREFKGYLRDTAKLPTHKTATEEEQQWFNKVTQRVLLSILIVWALYMFLHGGLVHGAVQNARSAAAAAWSDAWSDVAGVDHGSETMPDLERQADKLFLVEEHAYWQVVRPTVLQSHYGQWVAVVEGKLVVAGGAMNKVAAAALKATGKTVMFVARVGHEEATIRVLSGITNVAAPDAAAASTVSSDSGSPWYPLVNMVVRGTAQRPGSQQLVARNVSFLVDTGADLSAVTPRVAGQLQLRLSPVGRVRIAGWSGTVSVRQVYLMMARLASEDVVATVDVDAELCVLGRDILNDFELQASATHRSVVIKAAKGVAPSWEAQSECNCVTKCDEANGWWVEALDDVVDRGETSYENRMNGDGAALVKKWI